MPLPPLPPAGNMTHLHSYKVRLDLGCWVLVAGEGQNFISCKACKILFFLHGSEDHRWPTLDSGWGSSNMMIRVKIAHILSNEYHHLRSSNNQDHVPLGQCHPPSRRQRVWKETLCPHRCFLTGCCGSNRCGTENRCFRSGAAGVDFTSSSHRVPPLPPPFDLGGQLGLDRFANQPKCLMSLFCSPLFSFKTHLVPNIHHTTLPRIVRLRIFKAGKRKYICWNKVVTIGD